MRNIVKAILLMIISNIVFCSVHADSLKIGVVDMTRLVEEYSEIKGVQKGLQSEFAQKDETLKVLSLEMKKSQDKMLESEQDDNTRKESERNLLNLEREYARVASEFRQDYNLRRNEELYKMHKEITDAILEYADQNAYDLILESGMIYASDKLQLTEHILDALKQKLER